jgi:poly(hydroxyalkanoate) depolymerase family esterase
MDEDRWTAMTRATHLTREGRLAEATALIQRTTAGGPGGTRARAPEQDPAGEGDPGREPASRPARRPGIEPGPARHPAAGIPAQREAPPGGLRSLLSRLRTPPPKPVHAPGPLPGLGATPPMTGAPAPALPGRSLVRSHAGAAGERTYKLYVPTGYTGEPVPLVVMLHGGTQSADDFAAGTRMNELAERHTFLVAYPEQSRTANPMGYWNWFQPGDQHRDAGEPSLIAGITREVVETYGVDPRRVYVAGFSAGGAMAAVMAVAYPDLYAAAGVHSGLPYGAAHDVPSAFALMRHGAPPDARTAVPIPLIVFHGDGDPTVDQVNARCLVEQARAAGDPGNAERTRAVTRTGQVPGGHRYTAVAFRDAAGAVRVEQWTVHQAAHAWSGGSPSGSYTDPQGPDASAEILRFFREHERSAGTS